MGPAAASGSRFRRLPAAASGLRFRRLLPPPATSLRDVRGTGHSWSEIHFRDRGSIAVVMDVTRLSAKPLQYRSPSEQ